MKTIAALDRLGLYTADQWGMVTARQASGLGVDHVTLHRLKEAGLTEVVRHGVYALTAVGASEVRDEQAAWLSLRPEVGGWERPKLDPDGGVVSHRSAALIHGFGELVDDRVELTVPRRRTTRDSSVRLRRGTLLAEDVTVLDGLPVTTPLRTIRDLLGDGIDASHVATIVRQAVEAGQVQLDELADGIGRYARQYGVRPMDGSALLEHLLQQIGLSIVTLAVRRTPSTGGSLQGVAWEQRKHEPLVQPWPSDFPGNLVQ